jgi:uncharacterized protein (TIGR00730 family)
MNICVFCGSANGRNDVYAEAARSLANLFAQLNHTLVYGGGNVGLMGILADTILQAKGTVIGVIPDFLLKREVAHQYLTQLEVVDSMHERKKRMADLSNAFIAMPGGWGTLDELAEILTWKQLGLVDTPVGILNTNNFFDPLLDQMSKMVQDGFLQADSLSGVIVESSPALLISKITHTVI